MTNSDSCVEVSGSSHELEMQSPDSTAGYKDSMSIEDGILDPTAAGQASLSPPRAITGIRWGLLVTGIFSAAFLFSLDNTIVADVQPRIVEDLGEIEKLTWITVAFELGAVCFGLFWGKLYGLFSHKALFIAAVIIFEAGSVLCGASPNMNALIVGRAICGIGGNGIYLGSMNIVAALTTVKERPLYVSLFGISWGLGTLLGPLIGGAFSDSGATWRWAFYLNVCVGTALAPTYIFLLPNFRPIAGKTVTQRVLQLDLAGQVLFMGGFASGIMAISWGGALYAWNSSQIIGLFVCSAACWMLFVGQQAHALGTTPERRLFPAHLLKDRDQCILFAQAAASSSALYVRMYLIPLFFQFVQGDSSLQAGVALLPSIVVGVVVSIMAGALISRLGCYTPWYMAGAALTVVGAALMHTVGPDTAAGVVYGFTAILAIGTGCYTQINFAVSQAKVPKDQQAAATALIGCAQLSGMNVAFAVAYAVLLNSATTRISAILPGQSTSSIQAAIAGIGAAKFQNLPEEVRRKVLQAVSDSVADIYTQILATGALSLILTFFMKWEKLFLKK